MRIFSKRAGFTLIEVLVSVTLLAIIAMLVWQAMGSTVKSKARFEGQDEAFRSASLALDRVSRDLQMSFLFSNLELLGVTSNGEQVTKNAFIGSDQGSLDKVTFVTFGHVRYLRDSKESDQAEVSYFVESGGAEESNDEENTSSPEGQILKKRESSPPDAQPEEGGKISILLDGVKEFNLRYYDAEKGEYVDAWDSTGVDRLNKLPRAVEITLGVQSPVDEDQVLKFKTVVLLEMAPGPNDF